MVVRKSKCQPPCMLQITTIRAKSAGARVMCCVAIVAAGYVRYESRQAGKGRIVGRKVGETNREGR